MSEMFDPDHHQRRVPPDEKSAGAGQLTADEFLHVLQEKDLVSDKLLATLRKQIADAKTPISANKIAKLLIDKGFLTPLVAQRLLAAGQHSHAESQGAKSPAPESPESIAPQPAEPADAAAPGGVASLLDEELPPLPNEAGALAGSGLLDALPAHPSVPAAGTPLRPVAPRKGWRDFLRRPARRGKKRTLWDSPLTWISGGALLLVILGSAVLWALTRPSADEFLDPADDDYQAGLYAQAIEKYDAYLRRFPKDSAVGRARVRRGLAQLRLAAEGMGDAPQTLATAREVLPLIALETEFPAESDQFLAPLLADTAQALAARARKPPDAALARQAQEALSLLEAYVPPGNQPGARLGRIELSAALTLRGIARGPQHETAVAAIKKAAAAGKYSEAYLLRATLLKQFPELADDGHLKDAMLLVSKAQQAAVKWVAKQQSAESDEPPSAVLSAVALAQRNTMSTVPNVAGHVILAEAGGAAYGLDAATGRVLWRRFVGFGSAGRSPGFSPTPISDQPGSDVLVADFSRRELQRVAAATGQIRWRHPIHERFLAQPVIAGDRALVATRSGRLVMVDLASGDSAGYVQLPQPLYTAPAVDARRGLVFQAADQANLFVLKLADGRCRQVVHLGHEAGGISAPPVIAGSHLLVVVNDSALGATLRVLSLDTEEQDSAKPLLRPVQDMGLKGHVDTPPLLAEQLVLVATDAGALHIFELSEQNAKAPLREVLAATVDGGEDLVRFPLLQGGNCWLAGLQLTGYEVQLSQNRLVRKWVSDRRGAAVQPLRAIGQTIFHACRRDAAPGVVVSAVAAEKGECCWETCLGAPLVAEPLVDAAGARITAVTAAAGVFPMDAAGLKGSRVVDQPFVAPAIGQLRQPVTEVVRLSGDVLAMTGGPHSDGLTVVDPADQEQRLREWQLPGRLSCPPIACAGGLLVPSEVGQVFLLAPLSGNKQSEPFQPRLESGVPVCFRAAAPVGEGEVVLADDRQRLYRLGIVEQPRPHLAALAEVQLPHAIISPLAVVGEAAFGVDATGTLLALQTSDLSRIRQHALPGRCVWGPRRVGDRLMLSTDDDQLLCFDAAGKLLWQAALPYGPLAGPPLAIGKHYLLAAAGGVVWRVAADNGKELGKLETGLPLATGPVLLGEQLLVGGLDGTLYTIKQPPAGQDHVSR
jgi:outer membrane protein assembly factor BamB